MKKSDVVKVILGKRLSKKKPTIKLGKSFAPTNIALCKYWGKRDSELNLPITSSLSISLADKGATTEIKLADEDKIFLNDAEMPLTSAFSQRLLNYLNLFREKNNFHFEIKLKSNIPIAAGLASSACGFASIIQALNALFGWKLMPRELSILARLGSGSAARSIANGFVEWHKGSDEDGMDSYAELISKTWKEFCVGLCILNREPKKISSRDAMQRTLETSLLYSAWPKQVRKDLIQIKNAIQLENFKLLGQTAEANAMAMHATMLSAWPPIVYAMPETLSLMEKIWKLRAEGLSVYFTQDAGPNLKLLFLQKDLETIQEHFENVECVMPFAKIT